MSDSERLRIAARGMPAGTHGLTMTPASHNLLLWWRTMNEQVVLKQRVKEANEIVDVVGSYMTLRPVGQTFKGACPFHDDKKQSLDVDPKRQRFRCWSCNKVGDVIGFVQEFEKIGFSEAVKLLARRGGISPPASPATGETCSETWRDREPLL